MGIQMPPRSAPSVRNVESSGRAGGQLLLLVASYVSLQWLLLRYFLMLLPAGRFFALVLGACAAHFLVLAQLAEALDMGLNYAEMLGTRKLLRLSTSQAVWLSRTSCSVLLALVLGIILGLAFATCEDKPWNVMPLTSILASLVVHGRVLWQARAGLEKWREPQLTAQCLALVCDHWPTSDDPPAARRGSWKLRFWPSIKEIVCIHTSSITCDLILILLVLKNVFCPVWLCHLLVRLRCPNPGLCSGLRCGSFWQPSRCLASVSPCQALR